MQIAEESASFTVKLDLADNQRLAELAQLKSQSPEVVLMQAVHDYLFHEEARQDFISEAKASWSSYAQTGHHITLDEFADWTDKVKSQPDAAMPLCHK